MMFSVWERSGQQSSICTHALNYSRPYLKNVFILYILLNADGAFPDVWAASSKGTLQRCRLLSWVLITSQIVHLLFSLVDVVPRFPKYFSNFDCTLAMIRQVCGTSMLSHIIPIIWILMKPSSDPLGSVNGDTFTLEETTPVTVEMFHTVMA